MAIKRYTCIHLTKNVQYCSRKDSWKRLMVFLRSGDSKPWFHYCPLVSSLLFNKSTKYYIWLSIIVTYAIWIHRIKSQLPLINLAYCKLASLLTLFDESSTRNNDEKRCKFNKWKMGQKCYLFLLRRVNAFNLASSGHLSTINLMLHLYTCLDKNQYKNSQLGFYGFHS